MQFAWAEYISFHTIVTNYNEPLAAARAHIHVATHINVLKDGVALRSIGLHVVEYDAVGSSRLQVQFAWAVYITFYAIVTKYNEPLEADITWIDDARHIKWCPNTELIRFPNRLLYGCCE